MRAALSGVPDSDRNMYINHNQIINFPLAAKEFRALVVQKRQRKPVRLRRIRVEI
jgi:hypothetical protein